MSPSQKRHAAQGVVAVSGVPLPWAGPLIMRVPAAAAHGATGADGIGDCGALASRSALWLPRIHALVERQGHRCVRRTGQRVQRQEGLRVTGPSRRPKCPLRPEAKIRSEGLNDFWCLDLVFEVTTAGTTIRFPTIVDQGYHDGIDIVASRKLGAAEVIRALQMAIGVHSAPQHLRSDNWG